MSHLTIWISEDTVDVCFGSLGLVPKEHYLDKTLARYPNNLNTHPMMDGNETKRSYAVTAYDVLLNCAEVDVDD